MLLLVEGGAGHAETFLGLPVWIWQTANLILFFGLLAWLVARPLAQAFRKRQESVEQQRLEAERLGAEAQRLAGQIRERLSRLDGELDEVRARGLAEGEAERAALSARADEEAERVKREAGEEIERRTASARAQLEQAASDLVASAATELLSREIKADDRRRLLEDSVSRLRSGTR
jgi:F-type H+-transporting ATPase subunit b